MSTQFLRGKLHKQAPLTNVEFREALHNVLGIPSLLMVGKEGWYLGSGRNGRLPESTINDKFGDDAISKSGVVGNGHYGVHNAGKDAMCVIGEVAGFNVRKEQDATRYMHGGVDYNTIRQIENGPKRIKFDAVMETKPARRVGRNAAFTKGRLVVLEQKLIYRNDAYRRSINITPSEDDNNDIPVKRVTDVRAEEIEKEYLKRMRKFDTDYSDDNQCVQWLRGLHGKNVTPVVVGRYGEWSTSGTKILRSIVKEVTRKRYREAPMMELLEKEEKVMMRHYKWWIGTIMTKALAELKIERIGLARPNAREAQNVYDRFKKQSRNFGFSMATEEDEYFASGVDAQGHYRTWEFDKGNEW